MVTVNEPSLADRRRMVVFVPTESSIEKDPPHGLLTLMESFLLVIYRSIRFQLMLSYIRLFLGLLLYNLIYTHNSPFSFKTASDQVIDFIVNLCKKRRRSPIFSVIISAL